MTDRWTLVSQRVVSSDAVRIEDVRRRHEGLRYWLLVPFAGVFLYGALVWLAAVLASPFLRRRGAE